MSQNVFAALFAGKDPNAPALIPEWGEPIGYGELATRSGLDNLATRAAVRGGTFTIAARAPSGTTLDWAVPVIA